MRGPLDDATAPDAADAFWCDGAGGGAIRSEALAAPGPDQVRVRTLWSGISRGTETLGYPLHGFPGKGICPAGFEHADRRLGAGGRPRDFGLRQPLVPPCRPKRFE